MEVDETTIRGTPRHAVLRSVFVNQFDVRGADLRDLVFEQCVVGTAIVDEATRVPQSFPVPERIQAQMYGEHGPTEDLWVPDQVKEWLTAHGDAELDEGDDPVRNDRHTKMLRILGRACRSPSFWIPESSDTNVDKFVNDSLWPKVRDVLDDHGYIREDKRGVSGRRSQFVHIKEPLRILANGSDDVQVRRFYDALAAAAELD